MLPTIPSRPSVALSASDRAFIAGRRLSALAVRRIKLETCLTAFCVAVWTFNLSMVLGGAA